MKLAFLPSDVEAHRRAQVEKYDAIVFGSYSMPIWVAEVKYGVFGTLLHDSLDFEGDENSFSLH